MPRVCFDQSEFRKRKRADGWPEFRFDGNLDCEELVRVGILKRVSRRNHLVCLPRVRRVEFHHSDWRDDRRQNKRDLLRAIKAIAFDTP